MNDITETWPLCEPCQEKHPEIKICDCGLCMYKNVKQIPDDLYPIFECKGCKQRHWWD